MLTGFTAALLLITISELGDKTFFIAMILAMRYPRSLVLAGVVGALVSMTILSVAIGQVFAFLPKIYLFYAEIILFFLFGTKLLFEAWKMSDHPATEELADAEAVVNQSEKTLPPSRRAWGIVVESFVLTFVAEWGDRTQIATITLAAANSPLGVTLGASLGHLICAIIAVLGGQWIAGRISERKITGIGGVLFYVFALVAWWEGP
jgi:putative Ca2+/H+ antiporter (TMEM165/GDT1 family)